MAPQNKSSPWSPLHYSFFRMIWLATVVSNLGTWMQEVGAAWLMTSLTTNALLVALVQVASSLPFFLFALPAGALADILDRRLYLLTLQICMGVLAALLALTTFFHWLTPLSLLLYTFSLGMFYSLNAPAWQATIPELVPTTALPAAITLNSLSVNIARSIGPALAGIIIAASGAAMVFALNAISFIAVIFVIVKWKREYVRSALPTERLWSAMRAGIRYAKGSPGLQNILLIAGIFVLFASAIWALLPLVTRITLQRGPISYGVLLGLLGLGAVIGAFILQRARDHFNTNHIVQAAAIIFAISNTLLALSTNFYIACLATLLGGIAWIAALTTINTVTQLAVAPWIRARALSMYLVALFGGMAVGSTLWGFIALHFSISLALAIAAVGLFVCSILIHFLSLEKDLNIDHTLSGHSPGPEAKGIALNQGPTMVTVEYFVEDNNVADFTKILQTVRQMRLRNGAFFWNLFNDINDTHRFLECFMVESWVEHLRQHERASVFERNLIERVRALAKNKPIITHLVAYDFRKKYQGIINFPH